MRRMLVDTNVILDVVLKRVPFHTFSQMVWDAVQLNIINGCLTSSSLTDIYYIIRKKLKPDEARQTLRDILSDFELIHIDKKAALRALDSAAADIEDAMQYQTAIANKCEAIITRNVKDFPKETITIFTPEEFVRSS